MKIWTIRVKEDDMIREEDLLEVSGSLIIKGKKVLYIYNIRQGRGEFNIKFRFKGETEWYKGVAEFRECINKMKEDKTIKIYNKLDCGILVRDSDKLIYTLDSLDKHITPLVEDEIKELIESEVELGKIDVGLIYICCGNMIG